MLIEIHPMQTELEPGCRVLYSSTVRDSWEMPGLAWKVLVYDIRRPEERSRRGLQLPVQADLLWGKNVMTCFGMIPQTARNK